MTIYPLVLKSAPFVNSVFVNFRKLHDLSTLKLTNRAIQSTEVDQSYMRYLDYISILNSFNDRFTSMSGIKTTYAVM